MTTGKTSRSGWVALRAWSARAVGALALALGAGGALALETGCAAPDSAAFFADAAGEGDGGPFAPFDGGMPPTVDGSVGDVGPVPLGREADPDTSDDSAYAMACLDGIDADFDATSDCADAECSAAPSCCVGSTSLSCCTAVGTLYTLEFATCSIAGACGAPSDVVGAPMLASGLVASVDAGALADSGVLVREPIDLRSGHLTLTASVVVAAAPGAMVDAVAIGLYGQDAGGDRSLPIAAMQISASRGEISIVAGDAVVRTHELVASADPQTLVLAVSPAGVVTLTGPGFSLEATVDVPSTSVRVGALGRSELGTPSPVRIESIAVARAACDVPDALTPGAFALDDRTGLYDPSSVANPSLASSGAARFLAFDAEQVLDGRRAVFLAAEDPSRPGTFVVEMTSGRPQPIMASSSATEAASEPALGWNGTHWVLYATGISNRRRAILRSDAPMDGTFVFPTPSILDAPVDEFVSGEVPERDSPALVPGDWNVIVAREHTAAGSAIVLLDVTSGALAGRADAVCGVSDSCDAPSLRTSQTIVAPRVGTFAIDADEVSGPSVGYHRGVYRLYYAGRRGLRWSIGVVISADARYWRRPMEGSVALVPTGAGPAALGALGPDVTIDAIGGVTLYYTAWNGVDTSIALATQTIRR